MPVGVDVEVPVTELCFISGHCYVTKFMEAI